MVNKTSPFNATGHECPVWYVEWVTHRHDVDWSQRRWRHSTTGSRCLSTWDFWCAASACLV